MSIYVCHLSGNGRDPVVRAGKRILFAGGIVPGLGIPGRFILLHQSLVDALAFAVTDETRDHDEAGAFKVVHAGGEGEHLVGGQHVHTGVIETALVDLVDVAREGLHSAEVRDGVVEDVAVVLLRRGVREEHAVDLELVRLVQRVIPDDRVLLEELGVAVGFEFAEDTGSLFGVLAVKDVVEVQFGRVVFRTQEGRAVGARGLLEVVVLVEGVVVGLDNGIAERGAGNGDPADQILVQGVELAEGRVQVCGERDVRVFLLDRGQVFGALSFREEGGCLVELTGVQSGLRVVVGDFRGFYPRLFFYSFLSCREYYIKITYATQ